MSRATLEVSQLQHILEVFLLVETYHTLSEALHVANPILLNSYGRILPRLSSWPERCSMLTIHWTRRKKPTMRLFDLLPGSADVTRE